jgi:hypothetical protein
MCDVHPSSDITQLCPSVLIWLDHIVDITMLHPLAAVTTNGCTSQHNNCVPPQLDHSSVGVRQSPLAVRHHPGVAPAHSINAKLLATAPLLLLLLLLLLRLLP